MTREHFARLANPVKHYFTDKIGMDELNAGIMAANIIEAQSEIFEQILEKVKNDAS